MMELKSRADKIYELRRRQNSGKGVEGIIVWLGSLVAEVHMKG